MSIPSLNEKHFTDYMYAINTIKAGSVTNKGVKGARVHKRIKPPPVKRRRLWDLPIVDILTLDFSKLDALEASQIKRVLTTIPIGTKNEELVPHWKINHALKQIAVFENLRKYKKRSPSKLKTNTYDEVFSGESRISSKIVNYWKNFTNAN